MDLWFGSSNNNTTIAKKAGYKLFLEDMHYPTQDSVFLVVF